jgi:hypothetical protein
MVDTVVANVATSTPPAAPVKARRQKKSAAPAAAPAAVAEVTSTSSPAAPVAVSGDAVVNGHSNGTDASVVSGDAFRNAVKSIVDQQDALKLQIRNLLRIHKTVVQQAESAAAASAQVKHSSRRAAKTDPNKPPRHVVAAMYEMRPEFASFLMTLDPARERVSDRSLISRPQATKSIWTYIKSRDLQKKYPDDNSRILVDSMLANVLHLEADFKLTNKSLQTVLARLFYPRAPKVAAPATPASVATVA